jgi:mono/diheme cytochrome c family protein
VRLAAVGVAVLVLAGCGDHSRSGRYGPPATSGESTFIRSCGACHTLGAAGTTGTAGADLDRAQPTADDVLAALRNGPGPMPADLLAGDEAQIVANYVARVASG